jgi:hypothetical protein
MQTDDLYVPFDVSRLTAASDEATGPIPATWEACERGGARASRGHTHLSVALLTVTTFLKKQGAKGGRTDDDDIRALVKGPGLTACTVRTTASPGDRFRGRTFG